MPNLNIPKKTQVLLAAIAAMLFISPCRDEDRKATRDDRLIGNHLWTYVDSPKLAEHECDCDNPCDVWANQGDPWGEDCTLLNQLTVTHKEQVASLLDCAASKFPKTNSPDQDMCLRTRSIEGGLRAGLMQIAIEEMPRWDSDIRGLEEESLPHVAGKVHTDCMQGNGAY